MRLHLKGRRQRGAVTRDAVGDAEKRHQRWRESCNRNGVIDKRWAVVAHGEVLGHARSPVNMRQ